MIKAAFFDIDGTLQSFKTHRLSTGTIEAFDKLHARGIKTFISTGRPRQIIAPMPVKFDGYITMNGGYVYTEDKLLHSNPIPMELSNRWIRHAFEKGITTFSFMPDDICINRQDPVIDKLRAQLDFEMPCVWTLDEMLDKTVCQFIVLQPESMDKELLEMLPGCRLPRWHPAFSDLISGESSKAVGMQKIMDYFNIRQEETIAFGDGGNDIEMLDFAGIGVAMGNADDSVKSHADYITTDVDNEGIQHALIHLGII